MSTPLTHTPGPWTQHTPGPWVTCGDVASDLPHRLIADCGAGQFVVTAQSGNIALREHAEANAALIAQAPALAAEVQRLRAVLLDLADIAEQTRVSINAVLESKPGRDADAAAACSRGLCLAIIEIAKRAALNHDAP